MQWWMLRKPVHVSWIVAIYCYSLTVGVFISQYYYCFANIWIFLFAIFLFFVACYKKIAMMVLVAVVGGLLLGLWRGSITKTELQKINDFIGQNVQVVGTIKQSPEPSSSGKVSAQLQLVQVNNKKITNNIWISIYGGDVIQGDKITVTGVLSPGFGVYGGAIYSGRLIKVDQISSMGWLNDFKKSFSSAIEKAVGEIEAKLAVGFLLGQKKALPADMSVALRAVGLTHIVVASGYNLTILVRLSRRLFEKISKYLSTIFSVLMIIFFILITGLSPSMSRAGLVSLLGLLAWYYGRKFYPITLLALAMAGTLLFKPEYIWSDIGWRLSFVAFAGVMIIAPLGQRYLFGDKKPGSFRQILGETASAQIATLPIIILSFGQISNVAILANILILPFVPIVMLLSFLAGVGSLILPSLASLVGFPAKIILDYMIWVIEAMASLPWASSNMKITNFMAIIYYLAVVVFSCYMVYKTKYRLRDVNLVE